MSQPQRQLDLGRFALRLAPARGLPDYKRETQREVGGGIRMGKTCKSMADSCQCMAKTTTIL